jgi:hypothetical protein
MLILLDNGTPRTLARFLIDRHMVTEARARGWEELETEPLSDGRGSECSSVPRSEPRP